MRNTSGRLKNVLGKILLSALLLFCGLFSFSACEISDFTANKLSNTDAQGRERLGSPIVTHVESVYNAATSQFETNGETGSFTWELTYYTHQGQNRYPNFAVNIDGVTYNYIIVNSLQLDNNRQTKQSTADYLINGDGKDLDSHFTDGGGNPVPTGVIRIEVTSSDITSTTLTIRYNPQLRNGKIQRSIKVKKLVLSNSDTYGDSAFSAAVAFKAYKITFKAYSLNSSEAYYGALKYNVNSLFFYSTKTSVFDNYKGTVFSELVGFFPEGRQVEVERTFPDITTSENTSSDFGLQSWTYNHYATNTNLLSGTYFLNSYVQEGLVNNANCMGYIQGTGYITANGSGTNNKKFLQNTLSFIDNQGNRNNLAFENLNTAQPDNRKSSLVIVSHQSVGGFTFYANYAKVKNFTVTGKIFDSSGLSGGLNSAFNKDGFHILASKAFLSGSPVTNAEYYLDQGTFRITGLYASSLLTFAYTNENDNPYVFHSASFIDQTGTDSTYQIYNTAQQDNSMLSVIASPLARTSNLDVQVVVSDGYGGYTTVSASETNLKYEIIKSVSATIDDDGYTITDIILSVLEPSNTMLIAYNVMTESDASEYYYYRDTETNEYYMVTKAVTVDPEDENNYIVQYTLIKYNTPADYIPSGVSAGTSSDSFKYNNIVYTGVSDIEATKQTVSITNGINNELKIDIINLNIPQAYENANFKVNQTIFFNGTLSGEAYLAGLSFSLEPMYIYKDSGKLFKTEVEKYQMSGSKSNIILIKNTYWFDESDNSSPSYKKYTDYIMIFVYEDETGRLVVNSNNIIVSYLEDGDTLHFKTFTANDIKYYSINLNQLPEETVYVDEQGNDSITEFGDSLNLSSTTKTNVTPASVSAAVYTDILYTNYVLCFNSNEYYYTKPNTAYPKIQKISDNTQIKQLPNLTYDDKTWKFVSENPAHTFYSQVALYETAAHPALKIPSLTMYRVYVPSEGYCYFIKEGTKYINVSNLVSLSGTALVYMMPVSEAEYASYTTVYPSAYAVEDYTGFVPYIYDANYFQSDDLPGFHIAGIPDIIDNSVTHYYYGFAIEGNHTNLANYFHSFSFEISGNQLTMERNATSAAVLTGEQPDFITTFLNLVSGITEGTKIKLTYQGTYILSVFKNAEEGRDAEYIIYDLEGNEETTSLFPTLKVQGIQIIGNSETAPVWSSVSNAYEITVKKTDETNYTIKDLLHKESNTDSAILADAYRTDMMDTANASVFVVYDVVKYGTHGDYYYVGAIASTTPSFFMEEEKDEDGNITQQNPQLLDHTLFFEGCISNFGNLRANGSIVLGDTIKQSGLYTAFINAIGGTKNIKDNYYYYVRPVSSVDGSGFKYKAEVRQYQQISDFITRVYFAYEDGSNVAEADYQKISTTVIQTKEIQYFRATDGTRFQGTVKSTYDEARYIYDLTNNAYKVLQSGNYYYIDQDGISGYNPTNDWLVEIKYYYTDASDNRIVVYKSGNDYYADAEYTIKLSSELSGLVFRYFLVNGQNRYYEHYITVLPENNNYNYAGIAANVVTKQLITTETQVFYLRTGTDTQVQVFRRERTDINSAKVSNSETTYYVKDAVLSSTGENITVLGKLIPTSKEPIVYPSFSLLNSFSQVNILSDTANFYTIDYTSKQAAKLGFPGITILDGTPYPNPIMYFSVKHKVTEGCKITIVLQVEQVYYAEVMGTYIENQNGTILDFETYAFKDTVTNINLNNYIESTMVVLNKNTHKILITSKGTVAVYDVCAFETSSYLYYNEGLTALPSGANANDYTKIEGLWYQKVKYGATNPGKTSGYVEYADVSIWATSHSSAENVPFSDIHAYTENLDGSITLSSECSGSDICNGTAGLSRSSIDSNNYKNIIIAGTTTAYRTKTIDTSNMYLRNVLGYEEYMPYSIINPYETDKPYFLTGLESIVCISNPTLIINDGLNSIRYRFKEWRVYTKYNSELLYFNQTVTNSIGDRGNYIATISISEPGYYVILPLYERVYEVNTKTQIIDGLVNEGGVISVTYKDGSRLEAPTNADELANFFNQFYFYGYDINNVLEYTEIETSSYLLYLFNTATKDYDLITKTTESFIFKRSYGSTDVYFVFIKNGNNYELKALKIHNTFTDEYLNYYHESGTTFKPVKLDDEGITDDNNPQHYLMSLLSYNTAMNLVEGSETINTNETKMQALRYIYTTREIESGSVVPVFENNEFFHVASNDLLTTLNTVLSSENLFKIITNSEGTDLTITNIAVPVSLTEDDSYRLAYKKSLGAYALTPISDLSASYGYRSSSELLTPSAYGENDIFTLFFDRHTNVVIKATAASGYRLEGWYECYYDADGNLCINEERIGTQNSYSYLNEFIPALKYLGEWYYAQFNTNGTLEYVKTSDGSSIKVSSANLNSVSGNFITSKLNVNGKSYFGRRVYINNEEYYFDSTYTQNLKDVFGNDTTTYNTIIASLETNVSLISRIIKNYMVEVITESYSGSAPELGLGTDANFTSLTNNTTRYATHYLGKDFTVSGTAVNLDGKQVTVKVGSSYFNLQYTKQNGYFFIKDSVSVHITITEQYLFNGNEVYFTNEKTTENDTTTNSYHFYNDRTEGNVVAQGNTLKINKLNKNMFYLAKFIEIYQSFVFAEPAEVSGIEVEAMYYYNNTDNTKAIRSNSSNTIMNSGDTGVDYMNIANYISPTLKSGSVILDYYTISEAYNGYFMPGTLQRELKDVNGVLGLKVNGESNYLINRNMYYDIDTSIVLVLKVKHGVSLDALYGLISSNKLTPIIQPTQETLNDADIEFVYYVYEITFNTDVNNIYLNSMVHPNRGNILRENLNNLKAITDSVYGENTELTKAQAQNLITYIQNNSLDIKYKFYENTLKKYIAYLDADPINNQKLSIQNYIAMLLKPVRKTGSVNFFNFSTTEMFTISTQAIIVDSPGDSITTHNPLDPNDSDYEAIKDNNGYITNIYATAGRDGKQITTLDDYKVTIPTIPASLSSGYAGRSFSQYNVSNTTMTELNEIIAAIDTVMMFQASPQIIIGEDTETRTYYFAGWYIQKRISYTLNSNNEITSEEWSDLIFNSASEISNVIISNENTRVIAVYKEAKELSFTYNSNEVTLKITNLVDSLGNALSIQENGNEVTISGFFYVDETLDITIAPISGYAFKDITAAGVTQISNFELTENNYLEDQTFTIQVYKSDISYTILMQRVVAFIVYISGNTSDTDVNSIFSRLEISADATLYYSLNGGQRDLSNTVPEINRDGYIVVYLAKSTQPTVVYSINPDITSGTFDAWYINGNIKECGRDEYKNGKGTHFMDATKNVYDFSYETATNTTTLKVLGLDNTDYGIGENLVYMIRGEFKQRMTLEVYSSNYTSGINGTATFDTNLKNNITLSYGPGVRYASLSSQIIENDPSNLLKWSGLDTKQTIYLSSNSVLTLASKELISYAGDDYAFVGWFFNGTLISSSYSYTSGILGKISDAKSGDNTNTLEARFVKLVEFDINSKLKSTDGTLEGGNDNAYGTVTLSLTSNFGNAVNLKHVSGRYFLGSLVTLTVSANPGYVFVGFTDETAGYIENGITEYNYKNNPITLNSSSIYDVHFISSLIVTVNITKTTDINSNSSEIVSETIFTNNGNAINIGSEIIIPIPDLTGGYRFVGWYLNNEKTETITTDGSLTLTITGNTLVEARFIKVYELIVPNSVSVTCPSGFTFVPGPLAGTKTFIIDAGAAVSINSTLPNLTGYKKTMGGVTYQITTTGLYTFIMENKIVIANLTTTNITVNRLVNSFEQSYIPTTNSDLVVEVHYNTNKTKAIDANLSYITVTSSSVTVWAKSLSDHYMFIGFYNSSGIAIPFALDPETGYYKTGFTQETQLFARFYSSYTSSINLVIDGVSVNSSEDIELAVNNTELSSYPYSTKQQVDSAAKLSFNYKTDNNYYFAGWYINGILYTNPTISIDIIADQYIEARFMTSKNIDLELSVIGNNINKEDIKISAAYTSGNKTKITPVSSTDLLNNFTDKFNGNTDVLLVAKQVVGYTFLGWFKNDAEGTLVSDETIYKPNILNDINLVAKYRANHIVTVMIVAEDRIQSESGCTVSDGTQTISAISGISVLMGENLTLTATEENGYKFIGWRINGTVITDTDMVLQLINIEANINIEAVFAKQYAITIRKALDNTNIISAINAIGGLGAGNNMVITNSSTPIESYAGDATEYTFTYTAYYGEKLQLRSVISGGGNWGILGWYHFNGMTIASSNLVLSDNPEYDFIVTGDTRLVAKFNSQPVTRETSLNHTVVVTLNDEPHEYTLPALYPTVSYAGAAFSVSTGAIQNAMFVGWFKNGRLVSTNISFSYASTTQTAQVLEARFVSASIVTVNPSIAVAIVYQTDPSSYQTLVTPDSDGNFVVKTGAALTFAQILSNISVTINDSPLIGSTQLTITENTLLQIEETLVITKFYTDWYNGKLINLGTENPEYPESYTFSADGKRYKFNENIQIANLTIARFNILYTLIINSTAGLNVSVTPEGYNTNGEVNEDIPESTTITLTAVLDNPNNYRFVGWVINGTTRTTSYTTLRFTMDKDYEITPVINRISSVTVNTSCTNSSDINYGTASYTVNSENKYEFTLLAAPGYRVNSITTEAIVNGTVTDPDVTTVNTYYSIKNLSGGNVTERLTALLNAEGLVNNSEIIVTATFTKIFELHENIYINGVKTEDTKLSYIDYSMEDKITPIGTDNEGIITYAGATLTKVTVNGNTISTQTIPGIPNATYRISQDKTGVCVVNYYYVSHVSGLQLQYTVKSFDDMRDVTVNYTLILKANGFTEVDFNKIPNNSLITLLAPNIQGLKFMGWYNAYSDLLSSSGSVAVNVSEENPSTYYYYARYKEIEKTITINLPENTVITSISHSGSLLKVYTEKGVAEFNITTDAEYNVSAGYKENDPTSVINRVVITVSAISDDYLTITYTANDDYIFDGWSNNTDDNIVTSLLLSSSNTEITALLYEAAIIEIIHNHTGFPKLIINDNQTGVIDRNITLKVKRGTIVTVGAENSTGFELSGLALTTNGSIFTVTSSKKIEIFGSVQGSAFNITGVKVNGETYYGDTGGTPYYTIETGDYLFEDMDVVKWSAFTSDIIVNLIWEEFSVNTITKQSSYIFLVDKDMSFIADYQDVYQFTDSSYLTALFANNGGNISDNGNNSHTIRNGKISFSFGYFVVGEPFRFSYTDIDQTHKKTDLTNDLRTQETITTSETEEGYLYIGNQTLTPSNIVVVYTFMNAITVKQVNLIYLTESFYKRGETASENTYILNIGNNSNGYDHVQEETTEPTPVYNDEVTIIAPERNGYIFKGFVIARTVSDNKQVYPVLSSVFSTQENEYLSYTTNSNYILLGTGSTIIVPNDIAACVFAMYEPIFYVITASKREFVNTAYEIDRVQPINTAHFADTPIYSYTEDGSGFYDYQESDINSGNPKLYVKSDEMVIYIKINTRYYPVDFDQAKNMFVYQISGEEPTYVSINQANLYIQPTPDNFYKVNFTPLSQNLSGAGILKGSLIGTKETAITLSAYSMLFAEFMGWTIKDKTTVSVQGESGYVIIAGSEIYKPEDAEAEDLVKTPVTSFDPTDILSALTGSELITGANSAAGNKYNYQYIKLTLNTDVTLNVYYSSSKYKLTIMISESKEEYDYQNGESSTHLTYNDTVSFVRQSETDAIIDAKTNTAIALNSLAGKILYDSMGTKFTWDAVIKDFKIEANKNINKYIQSAKLSQNKQDILFGLNIFSSWIASDLNLNPVFNQLKSNRFTSGWNYNNSNPNFIYIPLFTQENIKTDIENGTVINSTKPAYIFALAQDDYSEFQTSAELSSLDTYLDILNPTKLKDGLLNIHINSQPYNMYSLNIDKANNRISITLNLYATPGIGFADVVINENQNILGAGVQINNQKSYAEYIIDPLKNITLPAASDLQGNSVIYNGEVRSILDSDLTSMQFFARSISLFNSRMIELQRDDNMTLSDIVSSHDIIINDFVVSGSFAVSYYDILNDKYETLMLNPASLIGNLSKFTEYKYFKGEEEIPVGQVFADTDGKLYYDANEDGIPDEESGVKIIITKVLVLRVGEDESNCIDAMLKKNINAFIQFTYPSNVNAYLVNTYKSVNITTTATGKGKNVANYKTTNVNKPIDFFNENESTVGSEMDLNAPEDTFGSEPEITDFFGSLFSLFDISNKTEGCMDPNTTLKKLTSGIDTRRSVAAYKNYFESFRMLVIEGGNNYINKLELFNEIASLYTTGDNILCLALALQLINYSDKSKEIRSLIEISESGTPLTQNQVNRLSDLTEHLIYANSNDIKNWVTYEIDGIKHCIPKALADYFKDQDFRDFYLNLLNYATIQARMNSLNEYIQYFVKNNDLLKIPDEENQYLINITHLNNGYAEGTLTLSDLRDEYGNSFKDVKFRVVTYIYSSYNPTNLEESGVYYGTTYLPTETNLTTQTERRMGEYANCNDYIQVSTVLKEQYQPQFNNSYFDPAKASGMIVGIMATFTALAWSVRFIPFVGVALGYLVDRAREAAIDTVIENVGRPLSANPGYGYVNYANFNLTNTYQTGTRTQYITSRLLSDYGYTGTMPNYVEKVAVLEADLNSTEKEPDDDGTVFALSPLWCYTPSKAVSNSNYTLGNTEKDFNSEVYRDFVLGMMEKYSPYDRVSTVTQKHVAMYYRVDDSDFETQTGKTLQSIKIQFELDLEKQFRTYDDGAYSVTPMGENLLSDFITNLIASIAIGGITKGLKVAGGAIKRGAKAIGSGVKKGVVAVGKKLVPKRVLGMFAKFSTKKTSQEAAESVGKRFLKASLKVGSATLKATGQGVKKVVKVTLKETTIILIGNELQKMMDKPENLNPLIQVNHEEVNAKFYSF